MIVSAIRNDVAVRSEAAVLPVPEIGRLHSADAVAFEIGVSLDLVVAYPIATQDSVLHRPIGRTERRETVLPLHVLGDLEATQRFDLPLRRAVPNGIRTPEYVVHPKTLDQGAQHRRAEARICYRRDRKA